MDAVTAVAAGIAIGTLTGLLPGLHVNLIAALALAIPGLPAEAALALLAIGVVHTVITILPSTYLGAPGDGMSVLPAHRLLHQGLGPDAVRLSLAASLAACMLALAALVPYRWALQHPSTLPFLAAAAPWVLLGVPVSLAMLSPRRTAALGVMLLAACLGHVAWSMPIEGWWPGSPLLPLLSGLFGVPTMLVAMRGNRPPEQVPGERHLPRGWWAGALRGWSAAAATGVLPGLTGAVAAAAAMPRRADALGALSVLSAVNTAHLCFAMGVLWILGRTRSGLALAWDALRPASSWTAGLPPELLQFVLVTLVAATAAVGIGLAIEPVYRRLVLRSPPGWAERIALTIIVGLVVATTGWPGVLLLVVSTTVGFVPLALGARRVHLAAALSIPIAIRLASS